jgi:hypothetical protein
MLRIHIAALAILLCIFGNEIHAQRTTPVIRQVDHILIESGDPKTLFSFFADILQLPIAWPVSENQGYVTGGVGAGNVNLELFRYADTKRDSILRNPQARYAGLAFEPYPLADALRRLQSVGIPYTPPEPATSMLPNGKPGIAWTTVGLPSIARPSMSIFLYEYSPVFLKVDVRRKQLGNRLTLNKGGPLGLLAASEIIVTATNLNKDREIWSRLLGKPTESGNWRAFAGPAIRLAAGDQDRIREIVLKVESLDRAKAFLKKNQLLGSVSGARVAVNPSKVQGLRISLIEK